ncbi:GNAT family N-acetyltransferase [Roseicyclus persicicus]|uniref:GNAT family N-acetyltransferase n=1 Tax=Roseicyclus persicicus TaxID=2650661 RepID=A0A7X6JZ82_9RHOB|nr:GNAT family N-acetyltransferase [Roseibacterium persicicum]NKX44890.1 GNAT family N-acetyltransferase [Roseibacterium persicicum]
MRIGRAGTEAARAACFAVRRAVFIEEQGIPEAEEWDDHDATCLHYLAEDDTGPLGTARLIARGAEAKIGRVAVLPRARGTGAGRALMLHVLDDARAQGFAGAVLDSQLTAIPFYERLGFVAEGPEYDDGSGILHRLMRRAL